jgi:8-hydroxy-5-deazaflavin:NADPH oxidoreductase
MRVTVIGAGHIGGTIGRAWLRAGHDVSFGVSSPEKHGELSAAGARVSVAAEAIDSADAVLLAVPGGSVRDVLQEIAAGLDGAVVIDATNNVGGEGPMNSAGAVAQVAPGASYYRAFNTLGWENFATPTFAGGERADLFYAGPDGPSRHVVEQLVADVGLHPVWVGGDEHVETVDGVSRLWFALVMGRHFGRHTAFRVLTDDA